MYAIMQIYSCMMVSSERLEKRESFRTVFKYYWTESDGSVWL